MGKKIRLGQEPGYSPGDKSQQQDGFPGHGKMQQFCCKAFQHRIYLLVVFPFSASIIAQSRERGNKIFLTDGTFYAYIGISGQDSIRVQGGSRIVPLYTDANFDKRQGDFWQRRKKRNKLW